MKSLAAIRKHCLAKSGAMEDEPWPGDKAWKVGGKIFAIGGEGAVTVKNTLERQSALIMHPAIKKAAYVGRFGWVSVEISNKETLALALDLIDESYDLVAAKKKDPMPKPKRPQSKSQSPKRKVECQRKSGAAATSRIKPKG